MTDIDAASLQTLESQFLENIEQRPVPLDPCLSALHVPVSAGRMDTAHAWTELLLDALITTQEAHGTLRLLEVVAQWPGKPLFTSEQCLENLRKVFVSPLETAMLEACGFPLVPPTEALRRFQHLRSINPGTSCLDASWGFGVVREIDDFYGRITVDFRRRPRHTVSFSHALDSIRILQNNHLLVLLHEKPAETSSLVQANPAALVIMALRDFGPMNAAQLEKTLIEHELIPSDRWKSFWESARKGLKEDPRCVLPAKRSEPLHLRISDTAEAVDPLARLSEERDVRSILSVLKKWRQSDGNATNLDTAKREIIADRLAFVLRGARNQDETSFVQAALLAWQGGFDAILSDGHVLSGIWADGLLEKVGDSLPQRDAEALIDFLLAQAPDAPRKLIPRLDHLSIKLLAPAINRLLEMPEDAEACATACCAQLHAVNAEPAWILWALQNRDRIESQGWIQTDALLTNALAALDQARHGESLRMQNSIRRYFEQSADLFRAMENLSPNQQKTLLSRIQRSSAWDSTTQRAVLGRIIKHFPALAEQTRDPDAIRAEPDAIARVTSRRSYRQRQAHYKQLIETEIPENSREIGQARSYGDLRENFEYHAARHQQGLLMQRKATLENDLKTVVASDFADVPTDQVAPGVSVRLRHANGSETIYHILGEWDRDETLGVIASRSRVAEILMGHKASDISDLPDENGQLHPVTLVSIDPLPNAIHQWISADDASDGSVAAGNGA